MLLLCACEGRPTWPANPLAPGDLSIARRCQQIGQLSNAPDAHLFYMPRNCRALHPRLSRAYDQLVFMPRRSVPSPARPHAESTSSAELGVPSSTPGHPPAKHPSSCTYTPTVSAPTSSSSSHQPCRATPADQLHARAWAQACHVNRQQQCVQHQPHAFPAHQEASTPCLAAHLHFKLPRPPSSPQL